MTLWEKINQDIEEIQDADCAIEVGEHVADGETVIGEMSERERAFLLLIRNLAEDGKKKIYDATNRKEVKGISYHLQEQMDYCGKIMWLEIQNRLGLWGKPLRLRGNGQIALPAESEVTTYQNSQAPLLITLTEQLQQIINDEAFIAPTYDREEEDTVITEMTPWEKALWTLQEQMDISIFDMMEICLQCRNEDMSCDCEARRRQELAEFLRDTAWSEIRNRLRENCPSKIAVCSDYSIAELPEEEEEKDPDVRIIRISGSGDIAGILGVMMP